MPIRYNSKSKQTFGVSGLSTGYDSISTPTDLTIPAVGLDDVDRALFKLFDVEIPFQVRNEGGETKDVPVIFAAAEKWALQKRRRALRDRNNTLILPLITIIRTAIQQSTSEDTVGRGINQQTGELMIKRRLDSSDRGYQSLINRLFLKHQVNVAVSSTQADVGQLTTMRTIGDLEADPTVQDGGLLLPDKLNNAFETLVLPTPQFFTALYEVTIWTQYNQHMNQLLEQLVSSFLPQAQSWRIDTPKGYWFVARVDGDVFNAENNSDDMSQEERMIKYKFNVKVPAYVLATAVPGAPVPIKRYVSVPSITFDVGLGEQTQVGTIDDPFLGADDPTLPTTEQSNGRRDRRQVGSTKLYPNKSETSVHDPALGSIKRGLKPAQYKKIIGVDHNGKNVTKYVRVASTNRFTGETSFNSDIDLGDLSIIIVDE
jgi:hypothetical protein